MNPDATVRHWGVITVLDALGSSEPRNEVEWISGLAKRKAILEDLKLSPRVARHGFPSLDPADAGKVVPSFDVKTETFGFSDTVAFVSEVSPPPSSPGLAIRAAWRPIEDWFVRAVLKGELYRGSISVGDYFRDGDIVMGPAINDAGKDYDRADWAGIVLTPSAGAFMTKPEVNEHPFAYARYNVPLHPSWGFARRELRWTLCWPTRCQIVEPGITPEAFWAKVEDIFARTRRRSVERKRRNTRQYFDEMWRRGLEERENAKKLVVKLNG